MPVYSGAGSSLLVETTPADGREKLKNRFFECLPGVLLGALAAGVLALLAFAPAVLVLVAAGYVGFWALRSGEMALCQVAEMQRLRRNERLDWDARLAHLRDPYDAIHQLEAELDPTEDQVEELAALRTWVRSGADVPTPDELYHLAVVPVYNESTEVLRGTLDALVQADHAAERLLVCLTFEARSQAWSPERIAALTDTYAGRFGMLMSTRHPDGLPSEDRVKGANLTWGGRAAAEEIARRGLTPSQVVVSALDCDTQVSRHYFQALSYAYLTDPDRAINGYQPVLLFHNNVWTVSPVARLAGYVASMWTLVDSQKPSRMKLFSSHAIGLTALLAVDFWATDVVPDDSRQHWRLFFGSGGRSRSVPLHVPVYLDAVQGHSQWGTMVDLYKQIRRWAWGVVDFPFLVEEGRRHAEIPRAVRTLRSTQSLVQFHLWATVPVLLGAARLIFGLLQPENPRPSTLAAYASTAMTVSGIMATAGLALSMVVALMLLPRRPDHRHQSSWIGMVAEFFLLPIVVPVFFCLPAMDAQIRLMAARYLGFRVTTKVRLQQLATVSGETLDPVAPRSDTVVRPWSSLS